MISPAPMSAYGRTGPIVGAIITLLISVRTLDFGPGILPKKSFAYANSSSKPMMPAVPIPTPRLSFLSSQFETVAHPASPPKL